MISLIFDPVSQADEFGVLYFVLALAALAAIAGLAYAALLLIKKVIDKEKQKELLNDTNKEV